MKLKLVLFFVILVCLGRAKVAAQADTNVYYHGEFKNGARVFLFADKVNVRNADAPTGVIVGNLRIATPLTIISKSEETFELNGMLANWYLVGYYDSKDVYCQGYVWGNLISFATVQFTENGSSYYFLCAPTSKIKEGDFTMTVKIVSNEAIVTSLDFRPIYTEMSSSAAFTYGVSASKLDKGGFSNVSKLVALNFEYGACGYNNGDVLFFWNGSKLVEFAKATRVSEAGLYNVSYTLVFPQDAGGRANTLFVNQRNLQYDPDSDDARVTSDITYRYTYTWTGSAVVASEQVEKILNQKK
ncbi:MAG: hypothetical protein WCQ95_06190 [Bacteroidota bacterium]